ncbi:hypothetical protein Mapa_000255 [Marchantia paleacea]|nr:hypothetical protein Mapa_000255 [Marchantia paleacea]
MIAVPIPGRGQITEGQKDFVPYIDYLSLSPVYGGSAAVLLEGRMVIADDAVIVFVDDFDPYSSKLRLCIFDCGHRTIDSLWTYYI